MSKRRGSFQDDEDSEKNSMDDAISGTSSAYFAESYTPGKSASAPVISNASIEMPRRPFQRLGRAFFDQPCVELAKSLLGKILVRKFTSPDDSTIPVVLAARIVETESYLGGEDRASHSFNGKRTERNAAMFMAPGTAYVYFTYGMYECFNISSSGDGSAVLIRSAEPLEGLEYMQQFRRRNQKGKKRKLDSSNIHADPMAPNNPGKTFKLTELCNGPSKLCMTLNITRQEFNQADLAVCDTFYVADDGYGPVDDKEIVNCARIGINKYGEWTTKPLRFYIRSSNYVSVKMKEEKR